MRDVVISASSLWARAIDLTVLVPSQGEWVQEVIRRTGQAPLHIFAPLRYGMPCHGARRTAAVTILETLFKHHWKRIRTVNLHAIRLDLSQEPVFEELLQQPAPRLEVFSVCLANPNTSLRLFSNDSPSLKECELPLAPTLYGCGTCANCIVVPITGLGNERSVSWHPVNFSTCYLICHS